jgi:amino acid permease
MLRRFLMVACVAAGFTLSYLFESRLTPIDFFFSFIGLGAALSLLCWLPVRYVIGKESD